MSGRLYYTDSDAANELNFVNPMALLIGFVLDQQVTVQKAFMGPLVITERLGSLDCAALAAADLDAIFRRKPAVHRYPGAMATRVHDLAVLIGEEYGGDAAAVWTRASSPQDLKARLAALPGFGEMKVISISSVLSKRFGVTLARELTPARLTLGDVDSPEALSEYQAHKRAQKKAAREAAAG